MCLTSSISSLSDRANLDLNLNDAIDVNLKVNTCVRLKEKFLFDESSGEGTGATQIALKAGARFCIDSTVSATSYDDVLDASAGVEVVASGGVTFEGVAAERIAKAVNHDLGDFRKPMVEMQLVYPGFYNMYGFTYDDICVSSSLSVLNSKHNFAELPQGCCTRRKLPHHYCTRPLMGDRCRMPRWIHDQLFRILRAQQTFMRCQGLVCDSQCYTAKSYTCPSGVPVPIKRKRKRTLCPAALTSCIPGRGGDSFECVDTKSDIESCKHFHNHPDYC